MRVIKLGVMPPLNLKLVLIKHYAAVPDKKSTTFKYLQDFFAVKSEAKVKVSVSNEL